MAGEETTNQGNVKAEYNLGRTGMNMDQSVNQIPKGVLSYALNAAVENFDANSVNYQNEPGNEFCLNFPTGYHLIGEHFINEKNKHVFFLANPHDQCSLMVMHVSVFHWIVKPVSSIVVSLIRFVFCF